MTCHRSIDWSRRSGLQYPGVERMNDPRHEPVASPVVRKDIPKQLPQDPGDAHVGSPDYPRSWK